MQIECGPSSDRRILNLGLPSSSSVAVLVSGGIDSAMLYFLLCRLNFMQGQKHTIKPYTVLRREGSRHHALPIIQQVDRLFNRNTSQLNVVGDNTLTEDKQVESGVREIRKIDPTAVVYLGVIESQPEHLIGWTPIVPKPNRWLRVPFQNLNKSHIIDLALRFHRNDLLELSHSCVHDQGRCGVCNGCRERAWAFDCLQQVDPGSI